jgi:hypothetical protein
MAHLSWFTLTTVAAALLLSPVGSHRARAQPDLPAIGDLKKLMPDDQLAAVEKVEEIKKLNWEAREEKNGLKRKEMQDQARANQKRLLAELSRKIQKDGLNGWVGVSGQVGPNP